MATNISKTAERILGAEVKFTPAKGSTKFAVIGKGDSARGLLKALQNLLPMLAELDADLVSIRDDKRLSDIGKQERIAKRAEEFKAAAQEFLDAIARHREALTAEVDDIAARVRGRFTPKDAGEQIADVEIRNLLRSMSPDQRGEAIAAALGEHDERTLRALSQLLPWDRSIIASEPMRNLVRDAIRSAEHALLNDDEKVSISNAELLLTASAEQVRTFASEAERLIKNQPKQVV
ncbi:MAG: hypothetical protein LC114_07805 [Bryobacterales bacterium]|nr:hypothetical protein [Bryobacterales bacterium]